MELRSHRHQRVDQPAQRPDHHPGPADGPQTHGQAALAVAHPSGQDHRCRVGHGADERQQRHPLEAVLAGRHCDQHPAETGHQCRDPVHPQALAQEQGGQDADEQGRREEDRRDLRQPHERKRCVEHGEAAGQQERPHQVDRPQRRVEPVLAAKPDDQRHKHQHGDAGAGEDQHPQRLRPEQVLDHQVLPDKAPGAAKHAGNALERTGGLEGCDGGHCGHCEIPPVSSDRLQAANGRTARRELA